MTTAHACTPECVQWIGTGKCHCSSCGMNFTTVKNFDSHRDRGRCLDPESVGLVTNSRGNWMLPGEVDFDARFGRQ